MMYVLGSLFVLWCCCERWWFTTWRLPKYQAHGPPRPRPKPRPLRRGPLVDERRPGSGQQTRV